MRPATECFLLVAMAVYVWACLVMPAFVRAL